MATCPECNGCGQAWYGNRSLRAICEICGGRGYVNDDGSIPEDKPYTPLWPTPLPKDKWRFG